MTTHDALKEFMGSGNLARALGISRQAIHEWGEYPPIGRQYQIEVLTEGVLRAERPEQTKRTGA